MYRLFLAGIVVCCFGTCAAEEDKETPSKMVQVLVSQADSYTAAYRQYQSLQGMLLTTKGGVQFAEQSSFPDVSQSQWLSIGKTLRQRAIAESSAFDAVLLLYLKQFNQKPLPEYCQISARWLAAATSQELSSEQSQQLSELMTLLKHCRQQQPFHALRYAAEARLLVEAYVRYGQSELAVEVLKKAFARLEQLQGDDRERLAFLLSHKGLDQSLAAISLKLAAQLEPAELRVEVVRRMQELPQFQNQLPELTGMVGAPERYTWKWGLWAKDMAEKGLLHLVEPGPTLILAQPELNEQHRNHINSILALGNLIAGNPQASLDAYRLVVPVSTYEQQELLLELAEHDVSGVYVKYVMQFLSNEPQPIDRAYSLFSFARRYLKAGRYELAAEMYNQGLDIMFEANYHKMAECGWEIVDALLSEGLIEQAERISQRFNSEAIFLGGVGEPHYVALEKESEFAVAYARMGDFHKSQLLLLSAKKAGMSNANNALELIDIYADANDFVKAERVAAWVDFYPERHMQAWLRVANGYTRHGDFEKAKARLDYVLGLLKHTRNRPSMLFNDLAKGYAAIALLPPELLKMAESRKSNSSLVEIAKVYAEAGLINLALLAICHIDNLDDQLYVLSWLEFTNGTELPLDEIGKAQLAKIVQQHFPLDESWHQLEQQVNVAVLKGTLAQHQPR
ncbi:tetratricopeptide repeat protein [Corallincola platygyrae]|uniref:Tetratricopeptide repeat protein n=1 Tax=Corallincola platygyrae TaxID=1193278 RepID=A0ABW4XG14_9GAMM